MHKATIVIYLLAAIRVFSAFLLAASMLVFGEFFHLWRSHRNKLQKEAESWQRRRPR